MRDYPPTISPGDASPARLGVPARRIPVDDATRNGNRAPLHDVLCKLHDGVAHRGGNRLEIETCGGKETLDVWGQIFPDYACLPARAQQQHRPFTHLDIRSGGEVRRFVRGHGKLLQVVSTCVDGIRSARLWRCRARHGRQTR